MSATNPLISVIVPTYDRPWPLAACLRALIAQDYPAERYEVIIVDDGSPTSPAALIAELGDRVAVRLISQTRRGPAAARNAGAAAARGQILAFTDDDCRPHTGWLRALRGRLAAAPNALVGGRTINALPENRYAEASQLLVGFIYDYFNRPGRPHFFTSNNIAMPRERFLAVGGFDASYPRAAAEDRDFCDRWQLAGNPVVYAPEAVIDHAHALTLRRFWRQHFNYGRGAYHYHLGHARRNQAAIKVEPAGFYLQLLGAPLQHHALFAALPLVVLMGLSQVANTAGFAVERIARAQPQPKIPSVTS